MIGIGAALSSASFAKGFLGIGGGNKKDPERIAKAQSSLRDALAGDLRAAQWINQQKSTSATQVGRDAYAEAWRQLEAGNPRIALEAAGTSSPYQTEPRQPGVAEQIGDELERLRDRVRGEVGTTVQRVGSGIAAGAAEQIDPGGYPSRFSIPTNARQLAYVGVALVLVVLVIVFLTRRKRR